MLNSVRLSLLLLACTAVCTAPGLLPVAGFPQVSSSRFRCAMVKRDYDDDLEKWTGDKEGAEDFDDAAIAEALSKFVFILCPAPLPTTQGQSPAQLGKGDRAPASLAIRAPAC